MKNPQQDLSPEEWEKFLKKEIKRFVIYSRIPSVWVQKRVQEHFKTLKMADDLYPKKSKRKKNK